MLVEITKEATVSASQQAAWALISDVPRLTGCIPGVSDVRELEPSRRYAATVTDKLGPFRLQLPVTITIEVLEEPSRLAAALSGNDGRGQARVTAALEARLEPAGTGTRLTLHSRLDVLGKLAALGATPMRRRADDIFAEFVRRVTALLGE